MKEWVGEIPFNEDDIKLSQAYNMACDIEDCYKKNGIPIKIRKKGYDPCCGNGFRFEAKPKDGTRIERIKKLLPTVRFELELSELQITIGNGVIYFTTFTEISVSLNNNLSHILNSEEYKLCFGKMKIAHPVGVGSEGNVKIFDLVEYPHAMVSGTTRSGKSTAIKCLLVSLTKYPSKDINLLIADRGTGLSMFDSIPHLSCPIIHDADKFVSVMLLLNDEMEQRRKLELSDQASFEKIPYIVFIVDEFSWFLNKISNNKIAEEIKSILNDILRYGRHNKIHLVLSIHDPKKEIAQIELGDIPTKLVFQATSSRKSVNAMDTTGAEKLKGNGDMIFLYKGESYHLQGVYIEDDKIDSEIQKRKQWYFDVNDEDLANKYGFFISDEDLEKKEAEIDRNIMNLSLGEVNNGNKNEQEAKFAEVVLWVLSQESVSTNSILEEKHVGNTYAKKYYQKLQSWGVIGDIVAKGRREVLPQSVEELPDDLRDFLSHYSVTDDRIMDAIGKRVK